MTVEQIAEVCHETNRAYCATLGDNSQPPWASAPEWQRTSAVNGVRFHLDNPDAKPSHSHDEWLKEKQATGWKFGPVKDAEKKEHPCFVPYEELPAEQKAKDALFIGVVHALRGLLAYCERQICPSCGKAVDPAGYCNHCDAMGDGPYQQNMKGEHS